MKLRGIFYAIAIAAIALAVLLLRGRPKEEAWSLEGQAVTADTCMVGCPCILGEPPPHGACQFVGIFHVAKGQYGKVSLDNMNFAVAGAFTRPDSQAKQTYQYVAYYLDTQATSGQKRALRRIFAGHTFKQLGKPAEVKEMPISLSGLENFGQVGKTYGGEVGSVAKVEVTPVAGSSPDQPMVITNSAEPMFNWTALGKATSSFYKSAGQNFQFEGTSGESHKFQFRGGGH
ncbi:MAG TPA: DUF1326 domain-containing protein [Terriglobia bacterium]|nr:DUF1326 domain-containing protein [Terriglobia bacterium]